MRSFLLPTALRRRGVLIAAGTVVLLAAGGGTTAAFASSADSTPSPAATCAPHLGALLRGAAPAALKADLKTLRGEPEADRAAERKLIRQKALSGAYGERIERLAHVVGGRAGHHHAWTAALPAALKADLKTLHGMTPKSAERKAEAQRIAEKALAGGYGTAVQTRAKAVQARVAERCTAK